MRLGNKRFAILNHTAVQVPSEYDTDAVNYFAAMAVQESDSWKIAANNFIIGLKADGLYTTLGWLNLFCTQTKQAALVNVINPAKTWTETGGTVAHTPGIGVAGDGAASYLAMGEALGASGHATQDSCHVGFHINREDSASAGVRVVVGATSNAAVMIGVARTSGNGQFRIGDGTTENGMGQMNPKNGYWFACRDGTTSKKAYRNDTLITTLTTTSTGTGANPVWLFKNSTSSYSAEGLAVFNLGSAWDATQLAAFNARKSTFLIAVGAN